MDYAGRNEERRQHYRRLRDLWPQNELITRDATISAAFHGDWAWLDELAATARERAAEFPDLRQAIAIGGALRDPNPGIRQRAITRAREILARSGELPLITLVFLYSLGARDEAFELVDQASFAYMHDPKQSSPSENDSNGVIFSVPYNADMMRDPRFPRLCAKLGLCDYWVKTERWPDCAEVVAPYYDFTAEARRFVSARVPDARQTSPGSSGGAARAGG